MVSSARYQRIGLASVTLLGLLVAPLSAQDQKNTPPNAETLPEAPAASDGEHPLVPVLKSLNEAAVTLEKIQDYTATLIMHERIGGKVNDHRYIFLQVRRKPFSVRVRFLAPENIKGQECIWVEGQNHGKMWVSLSQRSLGGWWGSIFPDGPIAMRGARYPITEIGILNLTRRAADVVKEDMKFGECKVEFFKGAKINDRPCTVIQVIHPVPRREFRFHLARIFMDDELNIPIRWECYDWPKGEDEEPQLIEEYTYLDVKLNVGLADEVFEPREPIYLPVTKESPESRSETWPSKVTTTASCCRCRPVRRRWFFLEFSYRRSFSQFLT